MTFRENPLVFNSLKKNDWLLISPFSISLESNYENRGNDHQLKKLLIRLSTKFSLSVT